jgi:hypothetical protein
MTATAEQPAARSPKKVARKRAPQPSREQVLLDLLANTDDWHPFYGPTGALLWRVPGSADGVTYTVSAQSCTCPYDAHRRTQDEICKHRKAVRLYIFIGEMYAIQKRKLEQGA